MESWAQTFSAHDEGMHALLPEASSKEYGVNRLGSLNSLLTVRPERKEISGTWDSRVNRNKTNPIDFKFD